MLTYPGCADVLPTNALPAVVVVVMCVQVPFPRMHFLLSSLAPLAAPRDVAALTAPRSIDQVGTCQALGFSFVCEGGGYTG